MRISIVTATLNRRAMLERALQSVDHQANADIEHIIVDGGSTDGTLAMLQKHPNLDVSSATDRNLYDAWNKGIARATGDFICILNSDDEIPEGALETAREILLQYPAADMLSGPVLLRRHAGLASESTTIIDDVKMLDLRWQDIGPGVPLTNGRLLSRRFIEKIGPFDVRYPAISDRQFFARVIAASPVKVTTSTPLYLYHVHDGSLTLNDNTPSRRYALEALQAAIDGMAENADGPLRNGFARWHAWASFYLATIDLRVGQSAEALKTTASAFQRDSAWLLKLGPQVYRHLIERRARQGHLYKAPQS
jgi:glycosyltransferase involved in cell wall biosynthesis